MRQRVAGKPATVRGAASGSCVPGDTTLCLGDGRFRVTATWATATGSGPAHAAPLTADTGTFWFFSAANVELILEVLDGCALNQHQWVSATGLTDVRVELNVEDTTTGETFTYTNPPNTAFPAVQRTDALAGCG